MLEARSRFILKIYPRTKNYYKNVLVFEMWSGKYISGFWNLTSLFETLDFVFISLCSAISVIMFLE